MKKLTNEQSEIFAQIGKKTDGDFNFSDAPRILDGSHAEIGKLYRPRKEPATVPTPRHNRPRKGWEPR
jgi:hypothetical protein